MDWIFTAQRKRQVSGLRVRGNEFSDCVKSEEFPDFWETPVYSRMALLHGGS